MRFTNIRGEVGTSTCFARSDRTASSTPFTNEILCTIATRLLSASRGSAQDGSSHGGRFGSPGAGASSFYNNTSWHGLPLIPQIIISVT